MFRSYPAALVGSAEKLACRFQKRLAKYGHIGRALQREIETVWAMMVFYIPVIQLGRALGITGDLQHLLMLCVPRIFNVMEFLQLSVQSVSNKAPHRRSGCGGARGMDGF